MATVCPVSVIIPTFNRAEVLLLCLEYLERQTDSNFNVIVVDDGSTDDTALLLKRYQERSPLSLTLLHQANSGPAKGRNIAIQAATSPLCILIGDDILASPDFVMQHRRLHEEHRRDSIVGLGLTRWDSQHQQITPFMSWLENVQFSYEELASGTQPDWRYMYTSNLSFKTKLFRQWPFDEHFRYAAFEDMELGYRLQGAGKLELIYRPEALATHVHPTSFLDACRRMWKVGYSEAQFLSVHPPAQVYYSRKRLNLWAYRHLAAHPELLRRLTQTASRVLEERHPPKLIAGLLMAHHQAGAKAYTLPMRTPG